MLKCTFLKYLLHRVREEYALCYRRYSFEGAERVHRTAVVIRDPWCEISVGQGSLVEHGTVLLARNDVPHETAQNSYIRIGRNCYIGQYNNIRTGGGFVEIGDGVHVAQFVSLIASGHGTAADVPIGEQPIPPKRNIIIGSDVWIGAGAIVLPGVTLHNAAVVGAGSVVTRDVDAATIVAGNPARHLRHRE